MSSDNRSYTVHFDDGRTVEGLDAAAVRALISKGDVGVTDTVSRNGEEPCEYFLLDEFVDLWDVDDFDLDGADDSLFPEA
ncbi:MAG: hypothetical protein KC561_08575, partial [Myxococcales bacterium]|nr:hypothetical protein [Myxococcales bacterium]